MTRCAQILLTILALFGLAATARVQAVEGLPIAEADSRCLASNRTLFELNFTGSSYRNNRIASNTKIDARGFSITGEEELAVRINPITENICMAGGVITGTLADDTTWSEMHDHTALLFVNTSDVLVEAMRIHNYGDGIALAKGVKKLEVSGVHLSHLGDDCIESDFGAEVKITDSLLDGCYTAFSTRPVIAERDTFESAHDKVFEVRDSLVWIKPMPDTHSGGGPGFGNIFKWDNKGDMSPMISIHDTIIRVDGDKDDGYEMSYSNIGIPGPGNKIHSCSNNTIVWLGQGEYPVPMPDCFTITKDISVWEIAVEQWKNKHNDATVPTPTPTPTPTPDPVFAREDIDQDGIVGHSDYLQLLAAFGQTGTAQFSRVDVIPDGSVDIFDYNAVLSAWMSQ